MQPVSPKKSTTVTPATTQPAPEKRTYDSSRRKRQAQQTRAEVLLAAMQLFNRRTWADTTLAQIADAAGVAVETIYNGFGSKRNLVREAFDAAVVGDAEPVPYAEREEFLRMGVGTRAKRLQAGMDTLVEIHGRSAGVWRALCDAAEGDADLTAWVLDADHRRRVDVVRSLELIFEHDVEGSTIDVLWILYSPETYWKLTQVAGLTDDDYKARLTEATLRLLGESA